MGVAVLMLVYALAEAIALLMGFSVLPPFSGLVGCSFVVGVAIGVLTERMFPARARQYFMANVYVLPLLAAGCGWVAGWLNILSILLFAALLVRVAYLLWMRPATAA